MSNYKRYSCVANFKCAINRLIKTSIDAAKIIVYFSRRSVNGNLKPKITVLGKKFQGKLTIQRSSELKIQMERYMIEVNAGGIIRPNGDFRLDCMAPFTIGNVLKKSVKEIWLEKGIDAWHSDAVKNFVSAIDEGRQESNIKNHVDVDFAL